MALADRRPLSLDRWTVTPVELVAVGGMEEQAHTFGVLTGQVKVWAMLQLLGSSPRDLVNMLGG